MIYTIEPEKVVPYIRLVDTGRARGPRAVTEGGVATPYVVAAAVAHVK